MRLYLLLLAALPAFAANPPSIFNVQIDDISHSSARITWQTDSASTTKLQWGLTTSYSFTKDVNWQSFSTHGNFISGLAPSTLYNVRACSRDTVESCSPNFTFTTLPAPSVHPDYPQPPAEVDVSMPVVNGSTLTADCSNLQSKLTAAAALDGALTHEVVLPAGTTCAGRYMLPARSGANPNGAGWLILRSAGTLPPEQTRITPATAAPLARIISNYVAAYYFTGPPGACELGDFWWDSDDPSPKLYRCTNRTGPVWTVVTAASGTVVPSNCTAGDWFFKTNEPDRHQQAWWCTEPNTYRNVYIDNGSGVVDWAAVYAGPNARRWRVVGLTIQALKTPDSYIAQFNQGGSDQKGSINNCLAYTNQDNDRIVFDRVVFDGIGYPNRTHNALCRADGSNIAIVNSYFNEINQWRTAASFESTPNSIFFVNGPGPVRIENNHFQNCHGITIFHSDDTTSGSPTSANDVVIRRNTFFESSANNQRDPAANGRYYYRRHMIEMKFGLRWLIEGNVFEGGWPAVNQGAAIALTPRPGFGNLLVNPLALQDVWIRNNIFKHAPQGFLLTGYNDYTNFQTKGTKRIAITGNLTYRTGISATGGTVGWPNNTFNGQFINMGLGIEDLTIQNNTAHASYTACCNLAFLGHGWDDANEGLRVANNIATMDPAMTIYVPGGVWQGGGFQGTTALNNLWRSWYFKNNLIHRPAGPASDYPSNTFWITNLSEVAYRDPAGFDFSLAASSPFHAGGAQSGENGGDLGASMYAIRAATGDVRGVQIAALSSTAAVFRYTTFDGQPCTLEVDTAAGFPAPLRYSDGGGARARLQTAGALSPSTQYYWRLHCGTTASGSFQTRSPGSGMRNVTLRTKPPAGHAIDTAIVEYGATPAFGLETPPIACAAGCTAAVAGTAGELLYYRVRYRNAAAAVVAATATLAAVP